MTPESEIQQLKKSLRQLHDAARGQADKNGKESLALGAARRSARQLLDQLDSEHPTTPTESMDAAPPSLPADSMASDLIRELEGDGSLAMFRDRDETGKIHKDLYRLFDYSTGADFPLSAADLNSISNWWQSTLKSTSHENAPNRKITVSREIADEIFDATGFNYDLEEVDNDDGTVTVLFDSNEDAVKFHLMAFTPSSEWPSLVFNEEKPAALLPASNPPQSGLIA